MSEVSEPKKGSYPYNLLWIDCSAGALVGFVVVSASTWLSDLFQLPYDLVLLMGIMNLVYASFSFSLAIRSKRPKLMIIFLVVANLTWAVLCVRWAMIHFDTASFFGLAQLLGEALFVGGLAVLEWRYRDLLVNKHRTSMVDET
ncbi:MAG: hypothetical protein ACFB15_30390 [Cyclobacteriaceae bacterium]